MRASSNVTVAKKLLLAALETGSISETFAPGRAVTIEPAPGVGLRVSTDILTSEVVAEGRWAVVASTNFDRLVGLIDKSQGETVELIYVDGWLVIGPTRISAVAYPAKRPFATPNAGAQLRMIDAADDLAAAQAKRPAGPRAVMVADAGPLFRQVEAKPGAIDPADRPEAPVTGKMVRAWFANVAAAISGKGLRP